MRILYVYRCRFTAPWYAAKYAAALSDGGAEVQIFQIGPTASAVRGLFQNCCPTRTFVSQGGSPGHRLALGAKVCSALVASKADCYIAADPVLLGLTAVVAKINRARLVYMPFEYFPGLSYGGARFFKACARTERRYAPLVSAWIAGGDRVAEEARRAYGLGDKVHVVYNAWPLQRELPRPVLREKLNLSRDHRIILYQGLISAKRGLLNVLSALSHLPDSVIFVLMGYGPDVELLRRRARENRVQGRIRVLEPVPQAELISHTCDADIGIIPIPNICRSYYLCNPGKLFEYIAAGLPLAVSNLAQLEWYVRTRGLGEIFDPEKTDDVVRALRHLLEDEEFRERCAASSRRIHLAEACWEIQAERLRQAVFGHLGETRIGGASGNCRQV